jgi:hypothetical protein
MGGMTIIKNTTARGTDRNRKLASLLLMMFLVLPTILGVASSAAGPVQPPVDTTTLYSTTIAWGPSSADPGRAYDSASGELIFNCYDTLISMGESVANDLGTWDTYESYWAFQPSLSSNVPTRTEVFLTFPDTGINSTDPTSYWFEPIPPDGKFYHIEQWIDNNVTGDLGPCDVLYIGEYPAPMLDIIDAITIRTWHVLEFMPDDHMTVHHFYYDFNIRTVALDGVSPINFVFSNGSIADTFDILDVEYTYEKVCARARPPSWMFNIPMFDQWYPTQTFGMGSAWASVFWAKMIEDGFEIVSVAPPIFRINVGIAFADGAFKQILTQTWASVMSQQWCLARGDFNPATDFYTDSDVDGIMDWYDTGFTAWPRVRGTNAPYNAITADNYCGTGPYRVTTADSTIEGGLTVFELNPVYWAANARPHVNKVQVDYVTDWAIRKQLFLDGKSDVTAVPRNNMFELLDEFGDPIDPTIKTVKAIVPVLWMDAVFYIWDVDPVYNSLYTGVFPDGAPTDLMKNIHVRNAFSYSFNHTKYIQQAYYGDGICRETPGILGLLPDYYTKSQWISSGGIGKFNYNLTAMEAELKQAYFVQGAENKSVWDWSGFHIEIPYNLGNEPRRIACQLIKDAFDALNAASGKNFQITIGAHDFRSWMLYDPRWWPVLIIGWLADYADAGNWYGPYMHSNGDFAFYQNYPATTLGPRTGLNKDQLIDFAFRTPDGPLRADMYADLDDIYLTDNPSFPVGQPLSRSWQKYWVKGWHYNALYPSQYYYHLYKEDTCWADVTGATTGVSDLKTDMRDISYVAAHFGAKAPNPGAIPPQPIYDPKWAPGTYGNGGCDVVGDRKVDMRDVAFAAAHFLHENEP